MRTRALFGTAAAVAASLSLAVPAVAASSAYDTDFTGTTITANDTAQWRMSGNYDAEIVTVDGNSMLRISNATTSGSFGDMLYAPELSVGAMENGPHRVFQASFDLQPVDLQPGLRITVSPDNGSGARAGFLAIEHREDGLALVTAGSYFTAEGDLAWNYEEVATGLDPQQTHRVSMKLLKKPDNRNNTNNDVFTVKVDGQVAHNTTFEAYYDAVEQDESPANTLLFRLSGAAAPEGVAGLLIDNLSMRVS